ncbi:MAG TPA: hypothetical protein VF264_03705 [Rhodanobacteraceae bacterium]
MKRVLAGLAIFIGIGWCAMASAQVYKCSTGGGAPSFQDHPCAAGQRQAIVDVPSHGPPSAAPLPAASVSPPASAVLPPPYQPPVAALPLMYACVGAVNGKHYLTRSPPGPYLAPLGVMGYPPLSLSEAYGAFGARHESIPALAPKVRRTGPSLGSMLTEVQDRCRPATTAEVCGVVEKEAAANQHELNLAMPHEAVPLRARQQQLEAELRNCR